MSRTTRLIACLPVLLLAGAALGQTEIYSNGSSTPTNPGLATGSTTSGGASAPSGFVWSEVQALSTVAGESNAAAGFSTHAYLPLGAYRFGDDFTVPPGRVWRIDEVSLFAYQTGAPLPPGTSPFSGVNLRISDSSPLAPGGTVLFGDITTNRMTASVATNILRVFNGTVTPVAGPADASRLVWQTTATTGGIVLQPGTYWIDWQYTTVATDAVAFSPAVTVAGQRTLSGWNALQLKAAAWTPVTDPGKPDTAADVPQDFPFILRGLDTCAIDFNLDGDTNPDDLSDYITCFFSEGSFPGSCPQADFNRDGDINPDDLSDFVTAFFSGC